MDSHISDAIGECGMTDDEILLMADHTISGTVCLRVTNNDELVMFARAIVAKEREWQGLTMEDIAELRLKGAYSLSDRDALAVDAKLKEKNS